jgi:hypothetical protein
VRPQLIIAKGVGDAEVGQAVPPASLLTPFAVNFRDWPYGTVLR